MWLEKFNHFGSFIDFDPDEGVGVETGVADAGARPVGVGDLLDGMPIAMAYVGGILNLYIGKAKFDLQSPSLRLMYEHHENGTTLFSAVDSGNSAQIAYQSWWRSSDPGVAAFGSSYDEDEDICAYIKFMAGVESRRKHVLAKYSQGEK